jgi:hypothetical protein
MASVRREAVVGSVSTRVNSRRVCSPEVNAGTMGATARCGSAGQQLSAGVFPAFLTRGFPLGRLDASDKALVEKR